MTLREKLDDILYDVQLGASELEGGDLYPDRGPSIDDIIALFREAMLEQDTVSHAILAHMKAEHTSPMGAAITAALDAITGEERS